MHLEEFDVFFVADGRLVSGPDSVDGVDARAVEMHRKAEKVAVFEQDALHFVSLSKALAVLAQLHAHARAGRSVCDLFNGVAARVVT